MRKISDSQIKMVGQEVASVWGAYCTGFERKKDSVIFHCNEHGEEFITELTYEEIKYELDLMSGIA